jgi:hypothetical protein
LPRSRFVEGLRASTAVARAGWDPRALLSPWQLRLFDDPAESRIADAGRGAGKTFAFAVVLLDFCLRRPKARTAFFAKTEVDARELILPDLLELNEKHHLGGVLRRSVIRFANGSSIRITGAADPGQAQRRFRGRRYHVVIGDEAQLLPWLRDMVLQAIRPAQIVRKSAHGRPGQNGRLMLGGTPGEVPGCGYWEEICAGEHPDWSVHVATVYDNPHVDVVAFLAARAKELGGEQAPIYRREYLRERVPLDASSGLIYRYSIANSPEAVTLEPYETPNGKGLRVLGLPGGRWTYGLAVDLGHTRDAASILVLGVTTADPGKVYEVEEFLFSARPLNPALAAEINARVARYKPIVALCDEGALGVQTADNLRAPPHNVPLTAADKRHPLVSSDAVNTGLINGALRIHRKSRLATDLTQLRWDPIKLAKGIRQQAKIPHSDLEPPLRYLWPTMSALLLTVKGPPRPLTEAEQEDAEHADEIREATEDAGKPWYSKQGSKPRGAPWKRK